MDTEKENWEDHIIMTKNIIKFMCDSLYLHRHRQSSQKYTFDECGKQFDLENSFKKHLRVHQPMTQCPQCGKMVRNIRQHISISHTEDDQKRVQCQDCGKGFARKDYLDKHIMNVHLKLRPHKCRYEGCDMSYNDYSNRNQHEKRTHDLRKKKGNQIA